MERWCWLWCSYCFMLQAYIKRVRWYSPPKISLSDISTKSKKYVRGCFGSDVFSLPTRKKTNEINPVRTDSVCLPCFSQNCQPHNIHPWRKANSKKGLKKNYKNGPLLFAYCHSLQPCAFKHSLCSFPMWVIFPLLFVFFFPLWFFWKMTFYLAGKSEKKRIYTHRVRAGQGI